MRVLILSSVISAATIVAQSAPPSPRAGAEQAANATSSGSTQPGARAESSHIKYGVGLNLQQRTLPSGGTTVWAGQTDIGDVPVKARVWCNDFQGPSWGIDASLTKLRLGGKISPADYTLFGAAATVGRSFEMGPARVYAGVNGDVDVGARASAAAGLDLEKKGLYVKGSSFAGLKAGADTEVGVAGVAKAKPRVGFRWGLGAEGEALCSFKNWKWRLGTHSAGAIGPGFDFGLDIQVDLKHLQPIGTAMKTAGTQTWKATAAGASKAADVTVSATKSVAKKSVSAATHVGKATVKGVKRVGRVFGL